MAKKDEFSIVDNYKYGYRNREDITNLPPGVLIVGSQNVLTNVNERVQIRQGYSVDGAASSTAAAVLASFDWITKQNGEVHMRAGGLTSAGNDGKLQYRYVDSLGAVTWRDLTTALTTVAYNFTSFWDTTEALRVALFVNGTSNIYEWNGAVTTMASATVNTITKSGTDSWLDSGFYVSKAGRAVVINGTTYTYTGGESTTTLTGVTPDPSGEAAASIVHQAVVTTANSAMTAITSTFTNGLIRTMNNQIFLGSLTSSVMWLSNINSYTNYSSSATRQVGEGGSLILDQNLVAFNVQGDQTAATMYVSTQDIWYKITFTDYVSVVGPSGQTIGAVPIKTGVRQGAQSQAFVSSMKNNTILVSNEPTVDMIGVMENFLTQIQVKNISDPIKLDIDSYDFTNGSIAYWRNYILVAVPVQGVVRIYNLATNSWEAPQTLPISRFYIVGGELYGHSYNSFESYKLFDGYADRVYTGFAGSPISAVWRFSYQNYGSRYSYKSATKAYFEGYINANTTLTATLTYELDGCKTVRSFALDGLNDQFVCINTSSGGQGSLGKSSLGKEKLGGNDAQGDSGLPPKFRWMPTFSPLDFFEVSVSLSVLGVDNRAEILAFGVAVAGSTQIPVQKYD